MLSPARPVVVGPCCPSLLPRPVQASRANGSVVNGKWYPPLALRSETCVPLQHVSGPSAL